MDATVEINNFGKIKDAKLQLKDLTIFAGTNNTGKSYASRILYSILVAVAIKPQKYYYQESFKDFINNLVRANRRFLRQHIKNRQKTLGSIHRMEFSLNRIIRIRKFIEDSYDVSLLPGGDDPKILLDEIKSLIDELKKRFDKAEFNGENRKDKDMTNSYHEMLDRQLKEIKDKLSQSPDHVVNLGYSYRLRRNLLHNFQAEQLDDLIGESKTKGATIEINFADSEDKIYLEISKSGEISKLTVDVIDPSIYSDIVYLESPFYWKLKNVLRPIRHYADEYNEESEYLKGISEYFFDLMKRIDIKKVSNRRDVKFKRELLSTIEKVIGGHIIKDENTRELLFAEKSDKNNGSYKKPISLHLTATGISQMGALAYLIEEDIIRKDTFFFIDEPEAHLHPEWQEKMMEILYELARYGVKVIVATHSPILIQRLDLFIKNDGKNRKKSLPQDGPNFFDESGKFDFTKKTSAEVYDAIHDSLERPAYNMYLREI